MNVFIRTINNIMLLLLANIVLIINLFKLSTIVSIILITLLSSFYIIFNINPTVENKNTGRIKVLIGGYVLLMSTIIILITETCIYLVITLFSTLDINYITLIINALVSLIIVFILMWNGLIRIMITSKQLGFTRRILLLLTWWFPLINLIIIIKCSNIVRREYMFEIAKMELNQIRKDTEVCKTKYPILLVHGIFWRDWQVFNYWGRIPKELIRNGATIFYGNHQSAASMESSANELKNQILNIIAAENCEKVNIIAHSKGGLDARYAISCLDMDEYVGSLTTICTPHLGSYLADILLKICPDRLIHFISERYNSLYKKLGDHQPDFLSGIYDLTTDRCKQFNRKAQNKQGVLYQCAASKMSAMTSAGFPLNLGYLLLQRTQKENDGFVTVESSMWGDSLGCYETKRKRGISHGDMIDLTRKNIQGFDVCECYVNIVSGLKAKNL